MPENDRNLYTGSTTTVDGSRSSGSVGKTLTYSWSITMKPEGSTAALSDTTAVIPSFTADLDGPYVVSLTVSDGTVTSAAATVTVTAAPLSYTDNGDSTVTDSLTGLMWHKGVSSTTNWYVASGTYHATYNSSTASTCGLVTAGSYTDWRLPTEKEMISIVDHGAASRAFDSTYFPIPGYISQYASFFWTATDYEGWAEGIYPGSGYDDSFSKTDSVYSHYVRCVRGALPAPSFTDNNNGTVTENNTGLAWQKCSAGKNVDSTCSGIATNMDWRDALDYCDSLELGGYTNWRLPNMKELVLVSIDQLAIFRTYFPNTMSGSYWSSTSGSPSEAWIMDFQYGSRTTGEKDNIYGGGYVRCVR